MSASWPPAPPPPPSRWRLRHSAPRWPAYQEEGGVCLDLGCLGRCGPEVLQGVALRSQIGPLAAAGRQRCHVTGPGRPHLGPGRKVQIQVVSVQVGRSQHLGHFRASTACGVCAGFVGRQLLRRQEPRSRAPCRQAPQQHAPCRQAGAHLAAVTPVRVVPLHSRVTLASSPCVSSACGRLPPAALCCCCCGVVHSTDSCSSRTGARVLVIYMSWWVMVHSSGNCAELGKPCDTLPRSWRRRRCAPAPPAHLCLQSALARTAHE